MAKVRIIINTKYIFILCFVNRNYYLCSNKNGQMWDILHEAEKLLNKLNSES